MRQRSHFFEHIQFNFFAPSFDYAGEAIRAEANVHAGFQKALQRKTAMAKILMAPRTMNDMRLMLRQQRRVAPGQLIRMSRNKILSEHATTVQMPYWRAQSAIGHIAGTTAQPFVHLAPGMHKHLKFLAGFRDMHANAQAALPRCLGAATE